jgi:histidinol-phosphate/aromatic aminotransferase/cobyric acid decarboxylase-like protein
MNANMKTNQAKLEADRKTDQEHMQDMLARIDTNRETHCEALKKMQARMKDTLESQIGFLVSRMEADRKPAREEMKTAIQFIRSELHETQVENIMTRINHKTVSRKPAKRRPQEKHI